LRDVSASVEATGRAALRDRPLEQPSGRRDHGLEHDAATARLPEDGHIVGVAAEGTDVALHPLQRGDLVTEPEIVMPLPEPDESVDPEPIVDADGTTPSRANARPLYILAEPEPVT
jgi:hypothetical protein